jgi:hypothetical protein
MNSQIKVYPKKIAIDLQKSARLFNEKVFGDKGWSKQNELLDAISNENNVAVRSGHALSKSYSFARVGLWFLTCYPHSRVVMTAPTDRQVNDIFWVEVEKAYNIAKSRGINLGGNLITKKLTIKQDWFMTAFTTKEYTPDAFAGLHAPYIMFIFDEASGIPPSIWDAAEGMKIGKVVKHIVGGQPFDPNTPFGECFKSPKWHKIHLDCHDSPNITGEKEIAGLVTAEWIKDKDDVWGVDNPLYQVRVLGNFPAGSVDTLIGLTKIEEAVAREFIPTKPYAIGLDVARFGNDSSVFTLVDYNGNMMQVEEITKQDTMWIRGRAKQLMLEWDASLIGVDVIGIGAGVYDGLVEDGINAIPINVASAPQANLTKEDPEQFKNLRAQIYWLLKQKIDKIHLIDKGRVVAECSDIKFKLPSGKIQIEAKEDIKKRKKFSPDFADSIVIALYTALYGLREFCRELPPVKDMVAGKRIFGGDTSVKIINGNEGLRSMGIGITQR